MPQQRAANRPGDDGWLWRVGLNRREFLVRAAALGLSSAALGVFFDACRSVEPTPTQVGFTPMPPTPTVTTASTPRPTQTSHLVPSPTPNVNPEPAATPTEGSVSAERTQIGHLLRRAGFGASSAELETFMNMGRAATVEYMIGYRAVDDSALESRLTSLSLDLERLSDLQQWWLLRMIYTRRPLLEKMVLFWHGLLTSAFKKVGKGPYMYDQNQLFRTHALGNYDTLLKAISRDPAMLIWLDSRRNKKSAPNENFARELMELFTMGIGHYTEADVRESARAFTGWGLRKKHFVFTATQHDFGSKTFLGHTGNFDGDDIIDIIMEQPATAEFISGKLFAFLVHDDPEPATLASLAETFRSNHYSIEAVVRQILTSPEFYSEKAYRAKIKSPAEMVSGTVRSLGIETSGRALRRLTDRMGQSLFNPFDVSGWLGGPTWINSSTLLQRLNFANLVAISSKRDLPFKPSKLVTEAGAAPSVEGAVDYFISLLLDGDLPSKEREILVGFLNTLGRLSLSTGVQDAGEKHLRSLVYLVLASPDYQLA